MTAVKSLVKKNTFYDSLTLMRISKKAAFEIKDVSQAVAVMASDVNKDMLEISAKHVPMAMSDTTGNAIKK